MSLALLNPSGLFKLQSAGLHDSQSFLKRPDVYGRHTAAFKTEASLPFCQTADFRIKTSSKNVHFGRPLWIAFTVMYEVNMVCDVLRSLNV